MEDLDSLAIFAAAARKERDKLSLFLRMKYYILGPDDQFSFFKERVEKFREAEHLNFPLSKEPLWNKTDENLFLIDLEALDEKFQDEIIRLKQSSNHKIIYFTNDLKGQSRHQNSSIGGDAYVSWSMDEETLSSMINDLFIELVPVSNEHEISKIVKIEDETLEAFAENPISKELNDIYRKYKTASKKPKFQSESTLSNNKIPAELALGDEMSDKDKELSLDDLDGLELSDEPVVDPQFQEDTGLDLDLSSESDFNLTEEVEESSAELDEDGFDFSDDLSLDSDEEEEESDSSEEVLENLGELDFDLNVGEEDNGLSLNSNDVSKADLTLSGMDGLDDLILGDEADLSEDAKEKLKEIDAIMDLDASQVDISLSSDDLNDLDDEDLLSTASEDSIDDGLSFEDTEDSFDLSADLSSDLLTAELDSDLDTSLVSDDVDLTSIDFPEMDEEIVAAPTPSPEKKKKPAAESNKNSNKEIHEIAGAYTGEMERLQATISNLRQDREELLNKIQKLEEDKILQNRENLSLRAELDERKIELSIIRRKLNDEISELKDYAKVQEEKKLILEEKNKIYTAEIDKLSHKNKLDVKKVQVRERELEQRLELLKADTETQIRHRDLKILELKRKIDSMEFDMESINDKEQKSVESKFELEDKLDKAIKTLRNAITLLEDDPDNKASVVSTLKKNIDM